MNITTNERALLEKINTAVAHERAVVARRPQDALQRHLSGAAVRQGHWVRLDHLPASSRDGLTGLLNTASATHVAPSLVRKGLIYKYRRTVRLTEAGLDAAAGGDGTDVTSKENRQ